MNGQCIPAGQGKDGTPCDPMAPNDECAKGLACASWAGPGNYCETLCDFSPPVSCPNGFYCNGVLTDRQDKPLWSTCLPGCDILSSPAACTVSPQLGGGPGACVLAADNAPLCFTPGNSPTGAPCLSWFDCVAGDSCVTVNGAEKCEPTCDTKSPPANCTCVPLTSPIMDLGYCLEKTDGGIVDAGGPGQ